MAFNTIWSVDLGKSALKAVKLRRDRNHVEILAVDKVDYPPSTNGVDSAAQAKEALTVFRARNEVKDPLVVAHPGQGTFSRFIKVPAFDQKKVKDMVRYEASQQIPFPLDEVIWDYHVVDREYGPGEEREVGLFAVRREAIDDYLLDFAKEGLSVEMLSIGYLGLLNFIKYDVNPSEPAIVLDIGAAHTDLILIDGERFWIRPLPHSGNDISKAIMARFKLDFPEAEKLKIETSKAPKQAAKIFQAVIQPKLQDLLQEIQRSIGYYKSQVGDIKFTRLYLLGNGSRIIGIKKFLEEHLGIPIERLQSIKNLRINRDVNLKLLQADLPAFGTAIGCGIQAVGVGRCQVDLVPREEKVKKEVSRKKKHAFIAAGLVAAFIFLSFIMINGKIARVNSAIQEADAVLPKPAERKKASRLEKEQTELTSIKMEQLKRVAEVRQAGLEGIRAVEKVLDAIAKKASPVDGVAEAGNKKAQADLVEKGKAQLQEKLWVPYLSMELTPYPEEAAAARAKASKAKGAKAASSDRSVVPSYKFRLFAMIQKRKTMEDSTAALRKMIEAPLKALFTVGRLTAVYDVKVMPNRDDFDSLYVDLEKKEGAAAVNLQQDGRPFFGAELQWFMVPRAPEAAPAETPKQAP
jgi:type IV pilus assembly protein PilM